LLITNVNPNTGMNGKYVIQADDNNKVIDSVYLFRVYIDLRDSVKMGN